ncbi:hypothetical protein [Paenibacillus donghaensis]|uniref:Uncharacterized protein n=1 Tax=Paenibacillus donghaensis TaxID=414771 RepID=A0A2Z2KLL2_9BACL|nr:hypothetical protein [Paenibacillus donghaensis]ASA20871.1 hypothetical protein B9T62_08805 [Paenibacillus donghaensis]ASA21456.1 hypothetical protein B9T62_12115 [Paenibacillus donghaensis]ASA21920.1 hypothetical protein B9T62_14735 [Paenibacillus donghaensis]
MGKEQGQKSGQDKEQELDLWNPWEEEEESEVWIDYICVKCGMMDPVPEFIVAECSYELEGGESPEFFCPVCNGTLVRKEEPADK